MGASFMQAHPQPLPQAGEEFAQPILSITSSETS